MAKESELLSLGGQAAAAAHSLGTPLSTILLIAKELKKEFGNNHKISKDLDLLISQSNRCREILKKLSLNPSLEDDFLNINLSLNDYVNEIVRSYQEISNKEFVINLEDYNNPINTNKSIEIIYGLRNFIGNAVKFSKSRVKITLRSDEQSIEIRINDDGPGIPEDIIHKIGEPYIKSKSKELSPNSGLGLGTFLGKTLLERQNAKLLFRRNSDLGGALTIISWRPKDFIGA